MNNYKRNFFLTGGLVVVLLLLAFVIVTTSDTEPFLGRAGHIKRNFCPAKSWEAKAKASASRGTQEKADAEALANAKKNAENKCTADDKLNRCSPPVWCKEKGRGFSRSDSHLIDCKDFPFPHIRVTVENGYEACAEGEAICYANCERGIGREGKK